VATCTIVITYTPGADQKDVTVTSFTVDGTAYGSLSDLQKTKADVLGRKLQYTLIAAAKDSGKGHGSRDITS
jgi:hypothetical protein